MAAWKFAIPKGGKVADIIEGVGTPIDGGAGVEVTIDFGSDMTRAQALRLFDQIEKRIHRGPWPPA